VPKGFELELTYAARRPWVPGRASFLTWTRAALDAREPGRGRPRPSLSIRIVGTARSRALNERYRQRPKPTNVLSFAGAGRLPDGREDLGELVICAPVVAREAALQGKAREAHWAHITVHGVLHLLGFDHERDADARKMMAREAQILDRLGFSDPYG
jgi:probable rRNA maturation factor